MSAKRGGHGLNDRLTMRFKFVFYKKKLFFIFNFFELVWYVNFKNKF
jgi:hypothetical protein